MSPLAFKQSPQPGYGPKEPRLPQQALPVQSTKENGKDSGVYKGKKPVLVPGAWGPELKHLPHLPGGK